MIDSFCTRPLLRYIPPLLVNNILDHRQNPKIIRCKYIYVFLIKSDPVITRFDLIFNDFEEVDKLRHWYPVCGFLFLESY